MKVNYNPEIVLTKEDIEKAIKEYVDKNIKEALSHNTSKVKFKLKDIAEDDDRGPYRPHYVVDGATVECEFLS